MYFLHCCLQLAAGVKEIAIFGSASEAFSRMNINCSIQESLIKFKEVTEIALAHGLRVRGYVSCVCGCPYEGHVESKQVLKVGDFILFSPVYFYYFIMVYSYYFYFHKVFLLPKNCVILECIIIFIVM